MKRKEKAKIIDEFLKKIGNSKIGTLPEILDNTPRIKAEKEGQYKIIEADLIKLELVDIIQEPGTNKTISGFGRFRISSKGLGLITSNKSSISLMKGKKIISDRVWDLIKLLIAFILGLIIKSLYDNAGT